MAHSSETPISHGLEGVSSEDRIRLAEIAFNRLEKLIPQHKHPGLFLDVSKRFELTPSEKKELIQSISETEQPEPVEDNSFFARFKRAFRDALSDDEE